MNDNQVTEPINNVEIDSPKDANFYLRHYIGDKYDKFASGGISIPYFFFGEYYLIYRKMYLPALIKFIISTALIFFILLAYSYSNNSMIILCFALYVLVQLLPIFIVRKFYYNYSKHKVDKILEQYKDNSEEELVSICQRRGGTSFVPVIILFIISFLFTKYKSLLEPMKTNEIHIKNFTTLSTDYLKFEDTEFDNFSVIKKNECEVIINTKRNTNSADFASFVGTNDVDKYPINNYNWVHVTEGKSDAYYTLDSMYFYKIKTRDFNTNSKCKKSIELFIDNLKFND